MSLQKREYIVWLTGLSGAGKSTIAERLSELLREKKQLCYVLDGDNVRRGLSNDLGFSADDRSENIRRVSEVARILYELGVIVIVAFITPYERNRDNAKRILAGTRFVEVFVDTHISECERRDPKGLYKKARSGEIQDFTGITSPFEIPKNPDIILETEKLTIDQCAYKVLKKIFPE